MRTALENFIIVIPTRDRADVLKSAIASALRVEHPSLKVLVVDNASVDATPDVIASFNDSRLSSIRAPKRHSMASNWELGLSKIEGQGWVTVIGDDDAVLPEAAQRVLAIAKATRTRAIRSLVCSFKWPSASDSSSGEIGVPTSRGYHKLSCKKMCQRVLAGKEDYTFLPVLYNGGFYRTELIEEIRSLSAGKFFHSPTPDVYSAFAVCSHENFYVLSHEPLAINGASKHSNGVASTRLKRGQKHADEENPAVKFVRELDSSYHSVYPLLSNGMPPLYLQAIVFEAFMQAHDHLGISSELANPARQAALILAESGGFGDGKIDQEWMQRYYLVNGITQADLTSSLVWTSKIALLARKFRHLVRRLKRMTLSERDGFYLKNVDDASQQGQVITKLPHGKLFVAFREIVRFVSKKVNLRSNAG